MRNFFFDSCVRVEEYNSRAILRRCHPTCVSQVQVFLQKFLQTRAFFFLFFYFFQKPDTRERESRWISDEAVDFLRIMWNEHESRMSLKENDRNATRGDYVTEGSRDTPAGKTSEHQAGDFSATYFDTHSYRPNDSSDEGISQVAVYLSPPPIHACTCDHPRTIRV